MTRRQPSTRNWMPYATLCGVIAAAGAFGFSGESRGKTQSSSAPAEPSASASAATTASPEENMPTRGVTLAIADLPDSVEARHILVQFDGAWKKDSTESVSRDDAKKLATQALAALRRGAAFDGVLEQYCNNASVRAEQGKFPALTRQQTMTAIANAVFPLKVGEYSEVTESVFGFHVFQRTR